jgi:hypothetical protein
MSSTSWIAVAVLGVLFAVWSAAALIGYFDKSPSQHAANAQAEVSSVFAEAADRMNRRAGYDDSFRLGPDRSRW